MATQLTSNPTFAIISQRLAPAIRKNILASHGAVDSDNVSRNLGKGLEVRCGSQHNRGVCAQTIA